MIKDSDGRMLTVKEKTKFWDEAYTLNNDEQKKKQYVKMHIIRSVLSFLESVSFLILLIYILPYFNFPPP